MVPPDLAFPKQQRLTRAAEFQLVREQGTLWRGPLFNLAVLRQPGKKIRAGFITSRKVGSAVVRNRVRRRLRELVRKNQARVIDGVWLIVIASPRTARASYVTLEDEWLRLTERASILAP